MPINPTRREALVIGGGALLPKTVSAKQTSAPTPFIRGASAKQMTAISELGEAFRRKYRLPGVSLAMTYRGKLKLLACFGSANREESEPVRPRHQFRIASVSKPITSVTILRLVEEGHLSLDAKIFAKGGHLSRFAKMATDRKQQNRLERITVRHLLEHSAGGWSNKRGEAPMFAKAALGLPHDELIRWTLQNRPLANDPGEVYAYSNFGYCLLGRVIESVTELSYEQAAKTIVLDRVGAKATFIAGHKQHQRRPDEVVYYDKYDPYGRNMDVARMDAHGGWSSTPTDLVRFAQHVDGFANPRDILKPSTLRMMTTPRIATNCAGHSLSSAIGGTPAVSTGEAQSWLGFRMGTVGRLLRIPDHTTRSSMLSSTGSPGKSKPLCARGATMTYLWRTTVEARFRPARRIDLTSHHKLSGAVLSI